MIDNNTIIGHVNQAVKEYLPLSGNLEDNEVPEAFLGPIVATKFYRTMPEYCYDVESNFEKLFRKLYKSSMSTKEIRENIGGYRADIAVFRRHNESRSDLEQIIEFKIADENTPPAAVTVEIERLMRLARLAPEWQWRGTICALLCPTSTRSLSKTKEAFQAALEQELSERPLGLRPNFEFSEEILANSKRWGWCVGICNLDFRSMLKIDAG